MTLTPQVVEVDFKAGLQTREDRKRTLPGELLELENATFRGGEVTRRPGTRFLSDALLGGGTLSEAVALKASGGELLRWTSTGVYSRGAAGGAWVQRGGLDDARPLAYEVQSLVARARSAEAHDCASVGALDVVVWTEAQEAGAQTARRVLRASVVERTSGARYQDGVALAEETAGTEFWRIQPRLVPLGTSVVLVYVVGTSLYAQALSEADPSTWGDPVLLASDVAARAGVRFPFETDAVEDGSGAAAVAYTGDSRGNAVVTAVTGIINNPAPSVDVGANTTFTGQIDFRVSAVTTLSSARVTGTTGPLPSANRTGYNFTGTIDAEFSPAPGVTVTKVFSPTGSDPSVTLAQHLYEGALRVQIARPPFEQVQKNIPVWANMAFVKAGQINNYGLAGGRLRAEVISRVYENDPETGVALDGRMNVRVTAPGYDVTFFELNTSGAAITLPQGYRIDIPGLDDYRNFAPNIFWEWQLYPLAARFYTVSSGLNPIEADPDGQPYFMYFGASTGQVLPNLLEVLDTFAPGGPRNTGIQVLFGVNTLLDANAQAIGYLGGDEWIADVVVGAVRYGLNGGSRGVAQRIGDPATGAALTHSPVAGITVAWSNAAPTGYATGQLFRIDAPTGAFRYAINAGAESSPLPIYDAGAQPITHPLFFEGSPMGISVRWAPNTERSTTLETWRAVVTSESRVVLQTVNNSAQRVLGPYNATVPVLDGLSLGALPDGGFRMVYRNQGANSVQARTFSAELLETGSALTVATSASSAASSGLLHTALVQVGVETWAILEPLAQAPLEVVRFTGAGVVAGPSVLVRGLRLLGRPFYLNGRPFLPCVYLPRYGGVTGTTPGIQPTAFLVALDTLQISARALASEAGALVSSGLPRPLVRPEGVGVVVPRRGRLVTNVQSGTLQDLTATGLEVLALREADPAEVGSVQDGEGLHLGGACPTYYDGVQLVEDGFHVSPEALTATVQAGGGALSAGRYGVVALYEWTDARGRRHQSAPSEPVFFTATANAAASVNVPLLPFTRKRGVRVVLYRTVANGTVYRRESPVGGSFLMPDVIATDAVTVPVVSADVSVLDNEALYTTGSAGGTRGGELAHVPPRPYTAAAEWGSYLVTNTLDEPYTYALSLPLDDGEGPVFADTLRGKVPSSAGRLVAVATLDERLLLACESGWYVLQGSGPARDGRGSSLSDPQFLTGSVGCVDARSVVLTPDGLLFQAPGGIYLLSRGLETVAVGDGVHEWRGLTVTGGVDVPSAREARLYTLEGRTLVYSYDNPRAGRPWATWTGQPARNAVPLLGVPHFADGAGVRREDGDTFREGAPADGSPGGQTLPLVVGTGWLKWAGLQGIQRVWRYMLLLEAGQGFTFEGRVFYDYSEDEPTVQTTEHTAPAGGVVTLERRLTRQLCKAARWRWTFTPSEAGDAAISLSAFSLEFGIAQGLNRRGNVRR